MAISDTSLHSADSLSNEALSPALTAPMFSCPSARVWKGIFGIRDLTKIRCGNRENDKYIDGIRDLTVAREAGLAKIGHGMRDLCLCVCRECRKPS